MLYIRDEGGAYLPAPKEVIFTEAKRLSKSLLKRGAVMKSAVYAKEAIQCKFSGYQFEMFACIFLDSKHRILEFQEMFRGSVNCATIHPREVVKEALRVNAAAVILVHNHPSGEIDPSQPDIELTTKLKDILQVIDVKVLDHLIVGDTILSMADSGYMS